MKARVGSGFQCRRRPSQNRLPSQSSQRLLLFLPTPHRFSKRTRSLCRHPHHQRRRKKGYRRRDTRRKKRTKARIGRIAGRRREKRRKRRGSGREKGAGEGARRGPRKRRRRRRRGRRIAAGKQKLSRRRPTRAPQTSRPRRSGPRSLGARGRGTGSPIRPRGSETRMARRKRRSIARDDIHPPPRPLTATEASNTKPPWRIDDRFG
mmetsp:Transcript_16436/g.24896  ORF Transcript_16436/g.24896 Transcript_16436/m.24896 type:complete len:207 (-) Transcript_16436:9-629(-)